MPRLPQLPEFVPRVTRQPRNQATRRQLNTARREPSKRHATYAAAGSLIKIQYGEIRTGEEASIGGVDDDDLVLGVVWGRGPIEGVQGIAINDAPIPSQVSVTHYTGTESQGVDPDLAATIAAYEDTLPGIAYSVFRIPPGVIGGWPRIQAVLRGRLLYDHRTDTTEYSANPGLALADLITSPRYGLGLDVIDEGVADRCDEVLGDVELRARIALEIAEARPTREWIQILASYAECYAIEEPGRFRLVPDAPVDSISVIFSADDMLSGTFAAEVVDQADSPTEVEIRYTDVVGQIQDPWREQAAISTDPGIADGEVPRVRSVVALEGVTSFSEAKRKAEMRRRKAALAGAYTWRTANTGILRREGQVVYVDRPDLGIAMRPVRITERPEMVDLGVYQVTARDYSAGAYPDDVALPEDTGVFPVGGILPIIGSMPDGWEIWTEANGRFLLGAGGNRQPGDTFGTSSHPGVQGQTSAAGRHRILAWYDLFNVQVRKPPDGTPPGTGARINETVEQPAHEHDYDTGEITPNLYRREQRLARKTGLATTTVPPQMRIWGLDNIIQQQVERVTQWGGRLLQAGSSNGNAGTQSQTLSITTGSFDDRHIHSLFGQGNEETQGFPIGGRQELEGGEIHDHITLFSTAQLQRNVRRRGLAIFGADDAYAIYPGMIIGYSPEGGVDLNDLPDEWVLCDGAGNTPDLRDYFVELAGSSTPGPAGDNTLSYDATTNTVEHDHEGGTQGVLEPVMEQSHGNKIGHNHKISFTVDWTPPGYALTFLMYTG